MYCRFKDGRQSPTPVWENVLLIEAADDQAAWPLAESRARLDEGDGSGSMTWGGRPAEWEFAGIRQLLTVTHESEGKLGHADEITYTEFMLPDLDAVKAFARDKGSVWVHPTLDQAMVLAMAKRRKFKMLAQDLADAVEEDGTFLRGDGDPPPRSQILARAQNASYTDLFEVTGPEGARVVALRCGKEANL
jgi:hypothetical protein